MPNPGPLPNLPNYPELTAALKRQRRDYMKRYPAPKSKLKLNDLFSALGTLAGAVYRDQLSLFTPERLGFVETFTFTHSSDGLISPIDDDRVPFPMNTTPTVKKVIYPQASSQVEAATVSNINETLSWLLKEEPTQKLLPVGGIEIDHPRLRDLEFETGATDFTVGFDSETKSNEKVKFDLKTRSYIKEPSQIVSHQFYFNFQGVRFGIVFLTNHRLSQANFVAIINGAVPKIENLKILKTVLVYAHFSVVESGWMHTSSRKLLTPNTFNSITRDVPLIHERNTSWYGYTPLRTFDTKTVTGKPVINKINLLFCDSMQLQAASLKKLGKDIRLDKVELEKDKITQMDQFLIDDPLKFIEYAIIDAVITAEAHLFFYNVGKQISIESDGNRVNIMSGQARNTMPSYSGEFFRCLFETHYKSEWKRYLGYDSNGMTDACKMFIRFYHGGRNDAMYIGPTNETHYLDLHSAYLSCVAMLPDYDFSDSHIASGADAEAVISNLMNNGLGPFQVAGVECFFRFKPGTKPVFPVRIAEAENIPGAAKSYSVDGIIYPLTGSSCVTWPEFWIAKHHGLLEHLTVNRITTFRAITAEPTGAMELAVTGVPTYSKWFANVIMQLLIARSTAETVRRNLLKSLLNFLYGRMAMGVNEAADALKRHDFSDSFSGSAITNFPLISMITGFCRATVGEIINFNKFYAVTTDAVITPIPRERLITPAGGLCQMVQDSFTARGFTAKPFIGTEASGNCGLFLKTRGYLIIDTETLVDGLPPTPAQCLKKMAAMGVQVDKFNSSDPIRDFLEKVFTGYADKSFFVKLTKIRAEQINNPDAVTEKRISQACKVDMTYDMKHVPVNIDNRSITWAGKTYYFPSFDTVPLQSSVDFHLLRSLRRRDNGRDLQVMWPGLSDPEFPQIPLTHTGDLQMPLSPEWTCMEFDTVLPEYVYEKDLIDGYFRDTLGTAVDCNFCSCGDISKELVVVHAPKSKKTLDFNYSTHRGALIDLLINMREIPTYMVYGDYVECMERFYKYSDASYQHSTPVVINEKPNYRKNSGFYTKIGNIDD